MDAARLEAAVRRTLEEAETLRVRVVDGPDGPRQVITPLGDWALPVVDLRHEPDPRAVAERAMWERLRTPLDPGGEPLFGCVLFAVAPDRFLWFHHYHHLVGDGFTVAAVARRVAELYTVAGTEGVAAGTPFPRWRGWSRRTPHTVPRSSSRPTARSGRGSSRTHRHRRRSVPARPRRRGRRCGAG
ncbi:hypothetical protein SANTM175S_05316 [Streptomyces antimycoticus]